MCLMCLMSTEWDDIMGWDNKCVCIISLGPYFISAELKELLTSLIK